jgi:hypothetical protein
MRYLCGNQMNVLDWYAKTRWAVWELVGWSCKYAVKWEKYQDLSMWRLYQVWEISATESIFLANTQEIMKETTEMQENAGN